jgi:hypothetical protein
VKTRQLAGDALLALGQRNTALARWRFRWRVAYSVEANLLLGLQSDRLDLPWARQHVTYGTVPPAGGAILVSLHHANSRVGFLRLSELVRPFGVIVAATIADERPDKIGQREFAEVMASYSRRSLDLRLRVFGQNIFSAKRDVRRALRFLQQDGYLVIQPDAGVDRAECWPVLGKALSLGEGAVWFARHSGKPLIPYRVATTSHGWRVILGDPIPPTMAAMAEALEHNIRATPTMWHPDYWQRWHAALPWSDYQARRAATTLPTDGERADVTPSP